MTRYQVSSDSDRVRIHETANTLIGQSFQDRVALEDFVRDVVKLPLDYTESVCEVLRMGRWKAKSDPAEFIRKNAQSAQYFHAAVPSVQLPKCQANTYASPRRHRDLKRKLTEEEQLSFDRPIRKLKTFAGVISDMPVPRDLAASEPSRSHDDILEHLTFKYGDYVADEESTNSRLIAPDVLCRMPQGKDDHDEDNGESPAIDWRRAANKAGFDAGLRLVLKCKREGISREAALAQQKTDADKLALQAAWRRWDRHGEADLKAALSRTNETPRNSRSLGKPIPSAIDAIRQKAQRREFGKYSKAQNQSLPRYTDFTL